MLAVPLGRIATGGFVTYKRCYYESRHGSRTFSVYTRHLKTAVGGVVVLTVVSLLLYAPTPATFTYTPAHSLSGDAAAAADMAEGETSEGASGPTCSPVTHLFFLKTHKCASTTVQNILFRFGYSRNLTFALPATGNYLGNPALFQAKSIPKKLLPSDGLVDIFAVHSRLHPAQHSLVLYTDARWLTVVREPAALYESLFNYYHMNAAYGFGLQDFSKKSAQELASLPRYGGKLGKNQMLFDLGYPADLTVTELRRALDEVDRRFDLVLIAERMDESLILLRHFLCWSLYDVVVFTKNARRNEVKKNLDADTLQALRELNSADVILYEYFLAKHKEAVFAFGETKMKDEVAALRG
ncbi:galactose-3-O-sulfotransferase 4-like isoform X3 [Scylla paramamosain]